MEDKIRRDELRQRDLTRGKPNKSRSCSEKGRAKVGNSQRGFCSHCKPALANRLARRDFNSTLSHDYEAV